MPERSGQPQQHHDEDDDEQHADDEAELAGTALIVDHVHVLNTSGRRVKKPRQT